MTLPRLWAFLAVGLPTLAALVASLSTVDLAYQLRAGAEILDRGAVPNVDTWTFSAAGTPWTDQQWAAQLILAMVYRLAGWGGLVLLRAALVAVIFGCLFELARRRGLGLRTAAWLVLAAFGVAAAALALRPQLMGMALFAVVLLLVSDRRAHPSRLWAVPLLVLVWANVHGSFFLGPLVLGLAWLEDLHDGAQPRHRTLVIAVATAAAACVTPFGPMVWVYAAGLTTNPEVTSRISEWQATSLRDPSGILFFASALAIVVLLARRGRSTAWPTLAWLAVFFVIGAYALRGAAWWPLGAVAAVAGLLPAQSGSGGESSRMPPPATPLSIRRLNLLVAGLVVAAGVAVLPFWRPIDPGLGAPQGVLAHAPSGITASLQELARPGDRLFQPQRWGSWFEFTLPDLPVAIDSRIEMYPAVVWTQYERVASGVDGWREQLEAWGVTLAVVDANDDGLLARLSAAGWQSAYTDEDGSVLTAPGR